MATIGSSGSGKTPKTDRGALEGLKGGGELWAGAGDAEDLRLEKRKE